MTSGKRVQLEVARTSGVAKAGPVLSEKIHTAFYCPAPVSDMQRASKVMVSQQD